MRKLILVLAVFSLIASGPTAYAWNGKGHMVVAYIAYKNLKKPVEKEVRRLLLLNPRYDSWVEGVAPDQRGLVAFMKAATWPDFIRSVDGYVTDGDPDSGGNRPAPQDPESGRNIGYPDNYRHKYWHFVDLPFTRDDTPLENAPTPNAETQILLFRDALHSAPSNVRAYDLAWLEHLVGDIHQPLHAAARFTKKHPHGDAGGNLVPLCASPCKDELHGFWDSILGPEDLSSALTMGEELSGRPVPAGADSTDVHAWVLESFELAKSEVYQPPISTDEPGSPIGQPTPNYTTNARTVAEKRVILAGRRLATLINDALGVP
jgi:S1/P1 nuclease